MVIVLLVWTKGYRWLRFAFKRILVSVLYACMHAYVMSSFDSSYYVSIRNTKNRKLVLERCLMAGHQISCFLRFLDIIFMQYELEKLASIRRYSNVRLIG